MSRIYEHPPFIGGIFDETVKEFVKLVRSAIEAGKRVLRVLEVRSLLLQLLVSHSIRTSSS